MIEVVTLLHQPLADIILGDLILCEGELHAPLFCFKAVSVGTRSKHWWSQLDWRLFLVRYPKFAVGGAQHFVHQWLVIFRIRNCLEPGLQRTEFLDIWQFPSVYERLGVIVGTRPWCLVRILQQRTTGLIDSLLSLLSCEPRRDGIVTGPYFVENVIFKPFLSTTKELVSSLRCRFFVYCQITSWGRLRALISQFLSDFRFETRLCMVQDFIEVAFGGLWSEEIRWCKASCFLFLSPKLFHW